MSALGFDMWTHKKRLSVLQYHRLQQLPLAHPHRRPAGKDRADGAGHTGRPGAVPGRQPRRPLRRALHARRAAQGASAERPRRHGRLRHQKGRSRIRQRKRLRRAADEAVSGIDGASGADVIHMKRAVRVSYLLQPFVSCLTVSASR